ncbi:hypothetical protein R1flu_015057 [Riccia fluitans]|uniref:Uncharacterized protein n=1 Tax=Riccia fluitans TaxID=41844 RepID=A0ABD1YHV3_9MARC
MHDFCGESDAKYSRALIRVEVWQIRYKNGPHPRVSKDPELADLLDYDMPEDKQEEDDVDKDINASASKEYRMFQPEAHGGRSTLPAVQNISDRVFGVDRSVHPPPPPLGLVYTSGGLDRITTIPQLQVYPPLPRLQSTSSGLDTILTIPQLQVFNFN